MTARPIDIYHITDIENLPSIIEHGLLSDALMSPEQYQNIGYSHIKDRRLTEIQVDCCNNHFVGEFVPFYYCPRSPMLYTINLGKTGKPAGCQASIVHLVSRVDVTIALGSPWAISDGNAGSYSANFYSDLGALRSLDWDAIRATSWAGRIHQKSAEFLVKDTVPWTCIYKIGCPSIAIKTRVEAMLSYVEHRPMVTVESGWYY